MTPNSSRTPTSWAGSLAAVTLSVALLAACSRGVDDRIRRVHDLGRNPTPSNKDRIEAMLRDDDRDVRATALTVMGEVDPARAKAMAAAALSDPDGMVRAAAVPIVGDGADDDAIRRLAARAVSDPAWQVRTRALAAIAPSHDPAVYEAFSLALADGTWRVRQAALTSGLTHPGLLPTDRVIELLSSDPVWENRVEAAQALGASQDPGAYPGLDWALLDPNEFVRATANRERRTLEAAGVAR